MNQNIEVLRGKKVIQNTPDTYVSQSLQLTLTVINDSKREEDKHG